MLADKPIFKIVFRPRKSCSTHCQLKPFEYFENKKKEERPPILDQNSASRLDETAQANPEDAIHNVNLSESREK